MQVETALKKKDYQTALKAFTQYVYELAYAEAKYNKTKTAKLLGVSRGHLYTKFKEFFI